MNLIPKHDNVIIQPFQEGERKIGSLHVVDAQERLYSRGRVLAVGPGSISKDGIRLPMQTQEDTNVVFLRAAGVPVGPYVIVRDGDVMAVEEGEVP